MARPPRVPSTPALRLLGERGVEHEVLAYRYRKGGGARGSAEALGLDLHQIVKTLVFETDVGSPFLVLMHGDAEVSEKALARSLGVRSVRPCAPRDAERHSGYRVGGTSPFGTRKEMPVYAEGSILDLPWIAINGGARGVLVRIDPAVLSEHLEVVPVAVAR